MKPTRHWRSGSAANRWSDANGLKPRAVYLAGRAFEAVRVLRHCLFRFLLSRSAYDYKPLVRSPCRKYVA